MSKIRDLLYWWAKQTRNFGEHLLWWEPGTNGNRVRTREGPHTSGIARALSESGFPVSQTTIWRIVNLKRSLPRKGKPAFDYAPDPGLLEALRATLGHKTLSDLWRRIENAAPAPPLPGPKRRK